LKVALGELCGGDHRAFADLDLVMHLVLRGDRAQDLQSRLRRGRFDRQRTKFAEERGIAIRELARSIDRGRREQAHIASCENGFEQVSHAAADRPLANQRVDVTHVEKSLFGRGLQRGQQLAQPLFNLTPELRSGDE
jgi:hypothetical protein